MAKEVMRRTAADNEYMHKDFHGALSNGLIYLQDKYGESAVREYLARFTRRFFAPLRRRIAKHGLEPIAKRLRRIYELEGAEYEMEPGDRELIVDVKACPAVRHMRNNDHPVSPLWHETIRTVHETLCENTPFEFELLEYEPQTGASRHRFYDPSATTIGDDKQ